MKGKKQKKVVEDVPERIVNEIVIIDDGSIDETYEILKDLNVKILRHKKNQGVGAAIRSGLLWGLKKN